MASFSDGAQWPSDNPKLQPVSVTLGIAYDISQTAATDDLLHSIDYSAVCKTLTASCTSRTFPSLESLCDATLEAVLQRHSQVQELKLEITRSRALLHPATTSIRVSRSREQDRHTFEELLLSNLEYRTIVGINDCEREDTQLVRFDITLGRPVQREPYFAFRELERQVFTVGAYDRVYPSILIDRVACYEVIVSYS